MFRVLWFTVKIALIAAAALWVVRRPGTVRIDWLGYDISADTGFAFFCLLAAGFVLLILHRLVLAAAGLPGLFRRRRERDRQVRGYRALTRGLAAVAAGDSKQAAAQAEQMRRYWPADRSLGTFLEAQAARLSGDGPRAEQSYLALLENRDAVFLGLRGLIEAALEEGRKDKALGFARQALRLHARQPWLLRTVYDLELGVRDWDSARETLKAAVRLKAIDGDRARGDRIAMLLYQAEKFAERGEERQLRKALTEAGALDPAFVPAAERLAQFWMRQGKRSRAAAVIEAAWKAGPHPELAALWETLAPASKPGDPSGRLRWFEKLVALRPDSDESQMAAGKAAMAEGLWGEARQYLGMAGQIRESARLCRMWAKLAEKQGRPAEAAHWLERAADAPAGEVWHCAQTGRIYERWSPIAQPHGAFNTIIWGYPGKSGGPDGLAAAAMPAGTDTLSLPPAAVQG